MVSPRAVIAFPSRSLGSTLIAQEIRGAKSAAETKKSDEISAAMPTLFFLNLRHASWRGLLLVSN
jgi:hypothetical protein